MEHVGQYYVPIGDSDDFGESVKFVHTKYPQYRVIIESRFPYRDAQGFARGVQNPDTALTATFRGRMFETNSARVIEALRTQVRGYIGKLGPVQIQELVAAGRQGGFFEVDKVEEKISQMREQLEREARARIEAELSVEKEAAVEDPMTETVVLPTEMEVDSYGEMPTETVGETPPYVQPPAPQIAGEVPVLECPQCGTYCRGKFCAECGASLMPRVKRQWACDRCGQIFDSGFKLGQHRETCGDTMKPIVETKEMVGGAGIDTLSGGNRLQGLL